MFRKNLDGVNFYSDLEIFQGLVVDVNENSGYWDVGNWRNYPNPFFIKICKRLWNINS